MERNLNASLADSPGWHSISGLANRDATILEWDDYLLKADDTLLNHDVANSHRSRLLVLSGTDIRVTDHEDEEILTVFTEEELKSTKMLEKDKEKMERLKKNPMTCFENRNSIHGCHFSDMKIKFFAAIHTFQPTAIILPHLAIKSANGNGGCRDITGEINCKERQGKSLKLNGMDVFVGSDE